MSASGIAVDVRELTAAVEQTGHAWEPQRVPSIAARFQALREQYQRTPAAFAPFVAALTQLRGRLERLAEHNLADIADRFHALSTEIQRLERERAFWRELLIRAAATRRGVVPGRAAAVTVRTTPARRIPPPGTPERARLEDLLKSGRCWEEVSQLSAPRLSEALADGALPPNIAAEAERLCPAAPRHIVTARGTERAAEQRRVAG